MKDYSQIEDSFETRKTFRKERKRIQEKDRSQFKKTDQEKKEPRALEGILRGRVVTIASSGIVIDCEGKRIKTSLRGTLKQDKSEQTKLLAVGDFVWLDDRGQITSIEPRFSKLVRADNLRRNKEQILCANIDQVIITVSAHEPEIKPSLIDRYIIATLKGNMSPVIVVNKIDLLPKPPLLDALEKVYTAQEIPFICVSCVTKVGIDALQKVLDGKASVFSGQSGVGKSSLINTLTGLSLKVGEIRAKINKGGHTTTHAELIAISTGGFCVDTPGIKSFALWKISKEELSSYFQDLQDFAHLCKYENCTHLHEPDCAVKKAVEKGKIPKIRYESYVSLYDEDSNDPWS